MKHGLWWWIDRWRESTAYRDMNLEQQGAYRNLLEEAWMRGGRIPNSEESLAKACGDPRRWKAVREAVLVHFRPTADGYLENDTLNEVMRESQRRRDKQAAWRDRQKGTHGGNTTGNGTGNADGNGAGLDSGLNPGSPITNHSSKELLHGRQAVPDRPARGARPAGPPVPGQHDAHVPELCGWVCLPRVFVEERLTLSGGASVEDIVAWALATREAFGDAPVDDRRRFDFWRARWTEATADVTPTAAEREQWALYTRSHGTLPLAAYVLQRRRGPHAGPTAPPLAPFITRKDQPA